MELYNSENIPLSNRPELREAQKKIINGETLTMLDKRVLGRDHPVKEINGYRLKPDHAYRAVSYEMFEIYIKNGMIIGLEANDEYQEYEKNGIIYNNNKGINWYLGGVELKYGNIILECPADKRYFTLAYDNGCTMSFDPTIRFIKSSGTKNPIPINMITRIFDVKMLKEIKLKEFSKSKDFAKEDLIQSQQLINNNLYKEYDNFADEVINDIKRK